MELSRVLTSVRQKRNDNNRRLDNTAPDKKKRKMSKRAEVTLFEYVRDADIKKAVNRFLKIYCKDKMQGVLAVKICILQSAGCIRKYNPNMGEDDKEILSYFEDWNEREVGPYLLLDGRHKIFYTSFCEFIQLLINTCEISNLLYDKFVLDKLLLFYGFVVVSEDESFRHAATLSALMTMRTLIKIIASKNEQIRKHNSQLNAEMRKPDAQKEMNRVFELEMIIRILKNKLLETQHGLDRLRKHVFEAEIMDSNTKIRSICFLEIGEWLDIHPEMVFQGKYLDYLLIPFANRAEVVTVHMHCFSILKSVFEGKVDLVEHGDIVQSFAKDIKTVLLRLAMSCETKLSSEAFCLLTKISKFDLLEDGESEQVYKFVYLDHPYRAIAKMAGEFIIGLLRKKAERDMAFGKIEAPTSAKICLLYHLVHFHIRNGRTGNAAFLVDSVEKWAPILQDWKSLKAFLLKEKLSEEEQTAFIEIFTNCVRKATMGQMSQETLIDFAEYKTDKKIEDKRKKFSEEFIDDLPQLIRCFRDDPTKISNVLLVTQGLSLNSYVELRKENSLIELLKEIRIVMEMSSDWKVLKECARTFKALCVVEHSTYATCSPICELIGEDLGNNCIKTFGVISNIESSSEPQLRSDLVSALKRVTAFSGYFNMYDETLFDVMVKCVNISLSNDDNKFLEECTTYSFLSCLRFLINAIRNILDLKKCDELHMNTLRSMLCDFMNVGHALLSVKNDTVRCEAFQGICQALAVFSKEMANTTSFQDLKSLVYSPSTLLVHGLSKFVRERIFAELPTDDWDAAKEEAARSRRCLYAFCRLLVNSTINDHKILAEIFGQYIKFSYLFEDIFDGMLDRIKKQDKCNFSLIVHKCLKFEFIKIKCISSKKEKAERIKDLQQLAKHFSNVLGAKKFGPEQQQAVVLLHDEGIKFSMTPSSTATKRNAAPPNIEYLEILILFVTLLTPQGRKHSYRYLTKCERFQKSSPWKPFVAYRKALETGKVAAFLPPISRRHNRIFDE